MAWQDFYRRRDAITAVLDHAEQHPDEAVRPEDVPAAKAEFTDTDDMLRALQHKWMRALTGRVGLALDDVEHDPEADHVDAVADAYRRTGDDQPALRRLLDTHAHQPSEAFRRSLEHEDRMLALSAGLAGQSEPTEEVTRIGAAFRALVRTPASSSERSRRPGALPLLRRLAASA